MPEIRVSMSPQPSIAHYRIQSKLGEGGMGAVYRATDTKLNRDVAVKVLPETFANDPERLARFTREAQVLASLNHPNIAAIYGVEDRALIMELVEGEDLKGPLPADTAIQYAIQIATALEAAHEKGVVHRDLKPANIKVTPQGIVKVLDFGLAAVTHASAVASGSPDSSQTMTLMGSTQAGLILGTASYMSPEQAAGKPVDKRADIWSFGVVLYETLTGKLLFTGETLSHTLADVLKGPIDLAALPADTPPAVRRLLKRCLERNLLNRLRDIGEARIALQAVGQETEPAPPAAPAVVTRTAWLWPAVAGLFVLLSAVLLFREWRTGGQALAAPVRATLDLNPAAQLANERFGRPHLTAMVFSPDGKTLVFSGVADKTAQLFKRALDQNDAVPIPGTTGATGPFFSPDGQWVGFSTNDKLRKVSLSGGPPVDICTVNGLQWGATWGAGNTIVFSDRGLKQVSADGGSPRDLLALDESKGAVFSSPEFLPDGKTLLFARRNDNWEQAEIQVLSAGGTPRTLVKGASPRYMAGYLLILRVGYLLAVPFDTGKLQLSGSPVALLDGVMQSLSAPNQDFQSAIGQFAVSRSGNLVYATGGIYPAPAGSVMQVDRKGTMTDLNLHQALLGVRFSPDGQRFAAYSLGYDGGHALGSHLQVYDLARGTSTRLIPDARADWPIWSPDGARIAFRFQVTSILSVRADGQGPRETIAASSEEAEPGNWSRDGKWLVYLQTVKGSRQIRVQAMGGSTPGEPRIFQDSDSELRDPDFSPDGKWISYVSAESGRREVYVQAFPGPGERQRLSVTGGDNPAWARNGRELFYLSLNAGELKMMAVDVQTGDRLRVGAPRELFHLEHANVITGPLRSYDVYPDGQHFLLPIRTATAEPPVSHLHLVLNWIAEVKQRAGKP
jgi:serine/threonine-protein kinase